MPLPKTFVALISLAIAQPANASCQIYDTIAELHALANKQVEMIKSTGEPITGPVKGAWQPSLFKRPLVHEVYTKFENLDTKSDYCIFNTRYGNPYLQCSFYFDEVEQLETKFKELSECASKRNWVEVTKITDGVALKTPNSLYNLKGDMRLAGSRSEKGQPKWHLDISYSRRSQ